MKRIILLGSTGSIGRNTLEIVRAFPNRFRIVALAVNSSWQALADQALEFRPQAVAISDEKHSPDLQGRLKNTGVDILSGPSSISDIIKKCDADVVVSAVVGGCGLAAAIATLRKGKVLALANKESLVMAGHLIMNMARENGAMILPIDSEHSAIFQAMQAGRPEDLKRVIITASGGPFFRRELHELKDVRPEDALAHPTWNMGNKITIDSATLVNKALEVVEARWLFNLRPEQISVVIHPQSIVHSFVEFSDGSILAQLGRPDMKIPIQYAMTFPERCEGPAEKLDVVKMGNLEFIEPDMERFPALRLGFEAVRLGGTYGATLSAANEVAVDAFLNRRIGFADILSIIETVLDRHAYKAQPALAEVFEADLWARREADKCLP